jgi:ferritin-like protein
MPMHIVQNSPEAGAGRAVAAPRIAHAPRLSRQALLRWSAVGGAALVLPRGASASAAPVDTPPDGDLAYLRLLIGAELLAIDFHRRALATKGRLGALGTTVMQSLTDERAHYATLGRLLQKYGQVPTTLGDVDFAYPRGSFASRRSIARLGWRIEGLLLGAYLGAIENVQTAELRLPIGQIAANEAQHLSALAPAVGKLRIGRAFPAALTMSAVSSKLDAFES